VERPLRIACLRGRTSDRTAGAGAGAEALAHELGGRIVGERGEPAIGDWRDDLPASRPVLEAAAAELEAAFADGALPLLTASDCTLCIATLPTVARHEPDVHVAWLDAHGDFNTPDTTESGFLGGMCLAAACGRWDAGWPGTVDPARVHLLGVRDLDPGEEREVDAAGVTGEPPADVPVYVHLDCDVLDPHVHASQFPVPGGWSQQRLRAQLAELAGTCRVVGLEITALEDPALAPAIADAIAPLLRAA
jgi:arginase family enzyme